jgi:hypothetical protein
MIGAPHGTTRPRHATFKEIWRAAILGQVGSIVKRLHHSGAVENIGAGRASKWKLAGS